MLPISSQGHFLSVCNSEYIEWIPCVLLHIVGSPARWSVVWYYGSAGHQLDIGPEAGDFREGFGIGRMHRVGLELWSFGKDVLRGGPKLHHSLEWNSLPVEVSCKVKGRHEFANPESTFVSDWDLTCDRSIQRTSAQVSLSLGKFCGSFSFGILADKWVEKCPFLRYLSYW